LRHRHLAALALAGCATEPLVGVPSAAQPVACAQTRVDGVAASALAIAGDTVVWATGDGVMQADLTGATQMIAPGAYDRVVAATVGDRVVVGASAGDVTMVYGSALGIAPYRELALIGGIAGASPVVTAGGARLAPSVWYGGLLVAEFDDSWIAHTAELAVLTPASTEVAATSVGNEATIVWPAGDACYVERAFDAANGAGWNEPGACRAPHVASVGGGVALVFEQDDGVHLALAATPDALHPSAAPLVAPGARSPRLIAQGGMYWLAYVDANGTAVAGFVDGDGAVQTIALAPASALELAVISGTPRVLALDSSGLALTALCAE
jgi:hypothetical protein